MADELSLNIQIAAALGYYDLTIRDGITVDWGTIGEGGSVQIIGFASEENVDLGDIVYPGYCYLKNLDSTNYIEYGPDGGGSSMVVLGRLLPDEFAVLRIAPAGATLMAQANTAACKLLVRCLEAGT